MRCRFRAGTGFAPNRHPVSESCKVGRTGQTTGSRADGLLSLRGGMQCQHDGKRSCGSSRRITPPATRGRARPRSNGSCRSRAASPGATAAAASRSRTSSRSPTSRSSAPSTASTPRAGPRSRPTRCRASRARSSATSATTAGPCASRATCRSSRCGSSGSATSWSPRPGTRRPPRRSPTAPGIEVEDVLEAREAFRALHSDSLDQPRGAREDEDSGSLLDTLGDADLELGARARPDGAVLGARHARRARPH